MSDLLRMTGMYSGLDTESVIKQMVSAREVKVNKTKGEQTKLEWKQKAWQDLNTKIYKLYSGTLSKLRLAGSYGKKTTTSSDPSLATVVASESAVNGAQTLKVNQVAKSAYMTGGKLAPNKQEVKEDGKTVTKEVKWTGKDKISEIDKSLIGKTITITTGTGDDKKTTDIEITEDMSITNLTNKLSDAGINASFDENNQRFFLSAKKSGADNDFKIEADDSTLKSLGLDDDSAKKIDGSIAKIELNGVEYESESNSFSINGLTINVTGVTEKGQELSIVTSNDYEGIYSTIKDFLTEYNELASEMDKLYNAKSTREYNMLTSKQKESMTDDEVEQWEDNIKGALLRKDSSLSSVINALSSTMIQSFLTVPDLSKEEKEKMNPAELAKWTKEHSKYLADYGIKTLNYFDTEENKRHEYHIDGDETDSKTSTNKDKLRSAIAADPEGTAEFFANVCKTMYDKLDKMMQRTDYSSIYKVYNDKSLQKEYADYTKRIKKEEKALSAYEDKWYKKFSAMETTLAKMQSNSNAVIGMLGK